MTILLIHLLLLSLCAFPVRWPSSQSQTIQSRKTKPKEDESVRESREKARLALSPLAKPFKRVWSYQLESVTSIIASDEGDRLFAATDTGRVLCLDLKSGELIWSAEPGGRITTEAAVGAGLVIVASTTNTGNGARSALRALDRSTGVTVWVRDYDRTFTSPPALFGSMVYAGSSDGSLYAVSLKGGEILWKSPTGGVVQGRPLIADRLILVGSDDGALHALKIETGEQAWTFQTAGKVRGCPATDNKAVYFGSGDGYVYAVDLATGKLRWKSRTGAGLESSALLAGDRVMIGSLDDFLYVLSKATGNRLWKRRLVDRIVASPIVETDVIMVSPFHGDHVVMFMNSDGQRVNYYQLDRGDEIIGAPLFRCGLLLLPTNRGIIAAAVTDESDSSPSKTPPSKTPRKK